MSSSSKILQTIKELVKRTGAPVPPAPLLGTFQTEKDVSDYFNRFSTPLPPTNPVDLPPNLFFDQESISKHQPNSH